MTSEQLIKLAEAWEKRAEERYKSAELCDTDDGRRLVVHGAVCWENAANELRQHLRDSR